MDSANAKPAVDLKPEDTEDWSVKPTQLSFSKGEVPSDAIILFDGTTLEAWQGDEGLEAPWEIVDGIARIVPGKGGISTREAFCDIQLHIEFRSPLQGMNGDGTGQVWGNSGVFLQSRYEVQVLNSFENETYANGQAASIYKQYPPLVNASKPPGEWQDYNVLFSSPSFDDDGALTEPAYVTVLHNGVLVQNHVEVLGPTRYIGLPEYEPHECAPLHLQDHGEAIEFRNIWVRKL
ncbi:MAG: DUF1080 domain-containing protein [Pseudomonadota bacterium]